MLKLRKEWYFRNFEGSARTEPAACLRLVHVK